MTTHRARSFRSVPDVVSAAHQEDQEMKQCPHCHRRQQTTGMFADALQLTAVFTVVPVIPLAVIEAHLACGVWGSLIAAMLLYGGFPSVFAVLIWAACTRKEGTIWQPSDECGVCAARRTKAACPRSGTTNASSAR